MLGPQSSRPLTETKIVFRDKIFVMLSSRTTSTVVKSLQYVNTIFYLNLKYK